MPVYLNLVDGRWVDGDRRPNTNPARAGETVSEYATADRTVVADAIDAANRAQPRWAQMPVGQRLEVLDRIGSTILGRVDELAVLLAREEGKVLGEARGEVTRAGQTFRYYAQQLLQPQGEIYASTRERTQAEVRRRPLGVVGEEMLTSTGIHGISFTGGTDTGQHVARQCIAYGNKRFQLEMGGKNPLVVLDDADLDVAVRSALDGSFFSTGQRCTASSRLIVQAGIHDRFVDALAVAATGLRVGDPLDERSQVGPVVSADQLAQNLDYVALGRREGATVVAGGDHRGDEGQFMRPTLFVDADNGMRLAREEIFGPVTCVIRVDDFDQAVSVANDTAFGLASGIITTSLAYRGRAIQAAVPVGHHQRQPPDRRHRTAPAVRRHRSLQPRTA